MTLHQLKVFLAVAKFRSFSLAGEALGIPQPSMSITVRALEQNLEVKLFETFGRKLHLTRAGEELFRQAEEILPQLYGIKDRLAEAAGTKKGKIRVGGSGLAGASFLPLAVQTFKDANPGVDVSLQINRSPILEKNLLSGELDVAVLGLAPHSPQLQVEPHCEDEIVVIAPPSHPLARKRSVSLAVLAQEPLIIAESKGPVRTMLEERFSQEGLIFAPSVEIDCNGGGRDPAKNAVAKGLGIGFISRTYALSEIRAGSLKVLNVPELNLKRFMCIAVHKKRLSSSLVRAFVEFLRGYKGNMNVESGPFLRRPAATSGAGHPPHL